MNLEELRKIDAAAQAAKIGAENSKRSQALLQELRTGPHTTIQNALEVLRGWNYGTDKAARDEFYTVLTEQMSNAMRIAELRLEAKSRAESAQAELLRAQVAAFFGEAKPTAEVSA